MICVLALACAYEDSRVLPVWLTGQGTHIWPLVLTTNLSEKAGRSPLKASVPLHGRSPQW